MNPLNNQNYEDKRQKDKDKEILDERLTPEEEKKLKNVMGPLLDAIKDKEDNKNK